MSRIRRLQEHLNIFFHEEELLKVALTHRSHVYEKRGGVGKNNERLEFLGDAVLDLIISEYLYLTYPHLSEGDMSKIKAFVISSAVLSARASSLGLGKFLFLGRGEDLTGGRKRTSLLCDLFEALLGAIYLDQGLDEVRSFILEHLKEDLENLYKGNHIPDYKTKLQELIQGEEGLIPYYETIEEHGPDHDKEFVVIVSLKGKALGQGKGRSKKEAEQKAAHEAFEELTRKGEG